MQPSGWLEPGLANYKHHFFGKSLDLALRSTITSCGQTVIPAAIRERFAFGPSQRLEWLVEDDGSIRVVPVVASPMQAFRGQGRRGGATARLLTDRQLDRNAEL